ncbi:MAG: DUF2334 domain-containing protein [bacterium]
MIWRIDDIGASTKQFRSKPWGPYQELTVREWAAALDVFGQHHVQPIIAITASWVDKRSRLIPFHQKFPDQAQILKKAWRNNLITVANHGLTHCVVGKHLPHFWSDNRSYHREFWPNLPQATHTKHVLDSQHILEQYFERAVTKFVPPGNVWSKKTYQALKQTNIKQVICNHYMLDAPRREMDAISFIDDRHNFFVCHDRDIKLNGLKWLKAALNRRQVHAG